MSTKILKVWINRLYQPENGSVSYTVAEYPFHGKNWMPVKQVEVEFEETSNEELAAQAATDLNQQIEDAKKRAAADIAELQNHLAKLQK